jgi:hypothetical protein
LLLSYTVAAPLIGRIVCGLFLALCVALIVLGLAWKRRPWRQRSKSSYTPTDLAAGMYNTDRRPP